MKYELVYHSIASPKVSYEEITNILEVARAFNEANSITGCLLFHEGEFLQVIEGDETDINALFSRISGDPRHEHVTILHADYTPERSFSNWSMAFKQLDGEDMKGSSAYLELDNFKTFAQLLDKPSRAKKFFYYASKSLLSN